MKNNNHVFYIEKRKDSISLDGEYQYGIFDTEKDICFGDLRYKTKLPASAYKSVYESGLLPHYYVDDNSKLYKDLMNKIFCYERHFFVPTEKADLLAFLCFDGADYKTEVILNGHHLGEHVGISGGPYLPVKEFLRFGEENELRIIAKSPAYGVENYDAHNRDGKSDRLIGWGLSGDALCSNGNFCVHGITGEIRLEFLSPVHISRPFLFTEAIEDGTAHLHFSAELTREGFDETAVDRGYSYGEGFIYAPNRGLLCRSTGRTYRLSVTMTDADGSAQHFDFDIEEQDFARSMIDDGRMECQYIEKDITLASPRLWFPYCLGEAHLYKTEIRLFLGEKLLDSHSFDFGVRTIRSRFTEAKKFFFDLKPYLFSVSGEELFLRGVNLMPQDFLYDYSDQKTERMLLLMKEAGISFIRLWGAGGKYETDRFYELCDRMGIMVWQDSIIANMTTGCWDVRLFDTLVSPNIYRLRNHPSLSVWCGGNEFNPYHTDTAACLGRLRQTLAVLDPTRIFFDTTPLGGSAHVYQNIEPTCYRKLYKEIPLMGESGIHTFPCYQSLKKSVSADELQTKIYALSDNYQKEHPKLMCHFVENNARRVPQMLTRASQLGDIENADAEALCYLTQLAAYEWYQIMGEAMIENFPKTAGHFPWVFSRGWNTIGIQLVDALECTTLQYYGMKKAFADLHAFLSLDEITYAPEEAMPLSIVCVSHKKGYRGKARAILEIYDPTLKSVYSEERDVLIDGYKTAVTFPDFVIPSHFADKFFFISLTLKTEDGSVLHNHYRPKCLSEMADAGFRAEFRDGQEPNFFYKGRETLTEQISAQRTKIEAICKPLKERLYALSIHNAGKYPAYPVIIDGENTPIYPEDNVLLIAPGETRSLTVRATGKDALRIHGLNFDTAEFPIE